LFDGWFRTGDIGQYRDGKVYIVDRAKDLIKYKALQVAPAELETVLLSHPLIADAAVIGVQGNDTELPRAYVVAVDRARIDEVQVKKWVKERVAEYKQLRGGVVFVDAIPKNASGKILKKDLRAMAQKDAQREGRAKL
jgi:4-coumarate--CoA ligase